MKNLSCAGALRADIGRPKDEPAGDVPKMIGNSPEDHQQFVDQLARGQSLREVSVSYRRKNETRKAIASIELVDIGWEKCMLSLLWRV